MKYAIVDYEGVLITRYHYTIDGAWNEAKEYHKSDGSLAFHYDICQNCQEAKVIPSSYSMDENSPEFYGKLHDSNDGREYPHDCMNFLLDETPEETLLNYFNCKLIEERNEETIKEQEELLNN